MGKITDDVNRSIAREERIARDNARRGATKIGEQRARAVDLKKSKGSKRDQKKLDDIIRRLDARRTAAERAEKALKKQLAWHDRQMQEIGEIEKKWAAEKSPARKKALKVEFDKRMKKWARESTPMFESMETMKQLWSEAKKLEREINNVETSDLVC